MIYYFGCWDDKGHYLHDESGRSLGYDKAGPFEARNMDAVYAPWPSRKDDHTNIAFTNGWTVLAMWDYSVDSRPGSNAAFLMEGTHTEQEMWREARRAYPQIVARLRAAPKEQANG